MALKIVHKLLVILRLKKKKHEKYDYDSNMHLESQGFYSEGLVRDIHLSLSRNLHFVFTFIPNVHYSNTLNSSSILP